MMDDGSRAAALGRMSGGMDGGAPPEAPPMEGPAEGGMPMDPAEVLPQISMVLEALAQANPELQEKISQAVALLGEAAGPKPPASGEMGIDAEAYGEMPPV